MPKPFWRLRLECAVAETKTHLSLSLGFAVRTVLVSGTSIALTSYSESMDTAMKAAVTAINVLLANLVTILIMFIFQWLRAPGVMHARQEETIATLNRAAERERSADALRELLGVALREGEVVLGAHDAKRAEEWALRIHGNIEKAYGKAAAALFLSDVGYVFYVSSEKSRLENFVRGRLQRLGALIERTPNPRQSFTSDQWRESEN